MVFLYPPQVLDGLFSLDVVTGPLLSSKNRFYPSGPSDTGHPDWYRLRPWIEKKLTSWILSFIELKEAILPKSSISPIVAASENLSSFSRFRNDGEFLEF